MQITKTVKLEQRNLIAAIRLFLSHTKALKDYGAKLDIVGLANPSQVITVSWEESTFDEDPNNERPAS